MSDSDSDDQQTQIDELQSKVDDQQITIDELQSKVDELQIKIKKSNKQLEKEQSNNAELIVELEEYKEGTNLETQIFLKYVKKLLANNNISLQDFKDIIYNHLVKNNDDETYEMATQFYACNLKTLEFILLKYPWKIIDFYEKNKNKPEYKSLFDKYYILWNSYNLSKVNDQCPICFEKQKLLTLRCGHHLCARDMCKLDDCPSCKQIIDKKYSFVKKLTIKS